MFPVGQRKYLWKNNIYESCYAFVQMFSVHFIEIRHTDMGLRLLRSLFVCRKLQEVACISYVLMPNVIAVL
jgi:hypothetical protein